jgi:hypothetical protein
MLLNQKKFELDDEEKEKIKYTIFSFPVASTFTPLKEKQRSRKKKNKRFCLKLRHIWGGELWNFHWGVICKS